MVRLRATLVVLAGLLGACAPISRDYAPAYDPPGRTVETSPVSVVVEFADGGGALPTYGLGDAMFVEGRQGVPYVVRLVNHTPDRYEAVVSVDGRDVVSGALGRPGQQRGYILEPYDSVVIDGYRRSLDDVAAFYFSSVRDSYTARRGTAEHAGVIGVALFEEKRSAAARAPLTTRRSAPPAPEPFPGSSRADAESAASEGPYEDDGTALGTGYGPDAYSPVYETEFRRRHRRRPDAVLTLYYDSYEGLQDKGIVPRTVDPYAAPHRRPRRADPVVDPGFAPEPWERDR